MSINRLSHSTINFPNIVLSIQFLAYIVFGNWRNMPLGGFICWVLEHKTAQTANILHDVSWNTVCVFWPWFLKMMMVSVSTWYTIISKTPNPIRYWCFTFNSRLCTIPFMSNRHGGWLNLAACSLSLRFAGFWGTASARYNCGFSTDLGNFNEKFRYFLESYWIPRYQLYNIVITWSGVNNRYILDSVYCKVGFFLIYVSYDILFFFIGIFWISPHVFVTISGLQCVTLLLPPIAVNNPLPPSLQRLSSRLDRFFSILGHIKLHRDNNTYSLFHVSLTQSNSPPPP